MGFCTLLIFTHQLTTLFATTMGGSPQGGAGYTFALPGNQAYNILPGNLYLPSQNSGYTVTYQKSLLLQTEQGEERSEAQDEEEKNQVKKDNNHARSATGGQGISAPRPGGYAL